jgi:RND family efflux transporter MFP subunit
MTTMKNEQPVPGEIVRKPGRIKGFFLHFLMPLAALACGVAITLYLLNTGPQAKPAARPPAALLVEVKRLSAGPQQTRVSAMGEIIPAREIDIKPQVGGEIVRISEEFQLGGYFSEGQEMVAIDRTDYELVFQQLKSDVAKAESDLELEMGNQRIAEREYALLGEQVSDEERNLILRKPQLEKLQAVRDDALSRLHQARINLERTVVNAPFNGVLAEKLVDRGTRVSESTTLARIVGTDSFWLRLTLPVEKLQWLKIPDSSGGNGSRVTVFPQGDTSPDISRQGRIVRLIASLEEQGRMAQVLVKIDDPLCKLPENSGKPKLLLGSYVRAEIEGLAIGSGYTIDRGNLHDGNTVWLMDENGRLDIRPVEVGYRGRDTVIVSSGVSDGEKLVVSTLSSPVPGTLLRLADGAKGERSRPGAKGPGEGKGQGRMNRVN